jgi:CO/xanthine dehydrogenase FAD-binding subunit
MRPFVYERPTTLAEVTAILASDSDAVPLAGGTDLIIGLRDRSVQPKRVVDVKRVAELDARIEIEGDRLVIGALAVMEDIANQERIRSDFTALAEAAAYVGSVQIRNRATLPGNICNASPAADTVPALLVYGATVVCAGPSGERRVTIDDFLVGPGVTDLGRGEIVTAVELPLPSTRRGSVHLRRTRCRGHDLASVTLAAAVDEHGRLRLAYGSLGPRPLLVTEGSGELADPSASPARREELLAPLLAGARPSPRSMRASPAYRLAMLRVLALRAIDEAGRRTHDGAAT